MMETNVCVFFLVCVWVVGFVQKSNAANQNHVHTPPLHDLQSKHFWLIAERNNPIIIKFQIEFTSNKYGRADQCSVLMSHITNSDNDDDNILICKLVNHYSVKWNGLNICSPYKVIHFPRTIEVNLVFLSWSFLHRSAVLWPEGTKYFYFD